MATRAFLIIVVLCCTTGCRPIMRMLFRSAARSAVRAAVNSAAEDEEEQAFEESLQEFAEALEELIVEPGEAMTFEQFTRFSDSGQACVLFVKAPYAKVAKAYEEMASIELEKNSPLITDYGVADYAVVATKDSPWVTIYHSLGGSMWFDQTAELSKRLKTRVFEFENDEVSSLYSVQPDGKRIRFMTENDMEWFREYIDDREEAPQAKTIDSYANMLAHYKIKPLVFTYEVPSEDEPAMLVLMEGEEERIKHVRAVAP